VLFHAHIRPIGTQFAQTRGRRFHSQGIRPALAYLFTISSQLRYCKHGDVMFDVVVRTVDVFAVKLLYLRLCTKVLSCGS